MFDLGATELLLIVVVAILVIGPKDMPVALRTAGRWIGKMRRLSGHFRSGLDAMIREAEMEEMEKTWQAQNARIMAQDPSRRPVEMEPTGALPPRAADAPGGPETGGPETGGPETSGLSTRGPETSAPETSGRAAPDAPSEQSPDPAYADGPHPQPDGASAEARAGRRAKGGEPGSTGDASAPVDAAPALPAPKEP